MYIEFTTRGKNTISGEIVLEEKGMRVELEDNGIRLIEGVEYKVTIQELKQ